MNDTVIKSGEDLIKVLGWCVWGIGCLWLCLNLAGLRNQNKRVGRVLVCLTMAAGLTVTVVTSFSKFHLLWIMMLPILPAIFWFVLLVPASLVYHKLTQRRPKQTKLAAQSYPPFEGLEWVDDGWEGKIKLPAWAGFQSRGGAYGSRNSKSPSNGSVDVNVKPAEGAKELMPSDAQCRAMKHHIEQGEAVVQAIVAGLLNSTRPHYEQLRKKLKHTDENSPATPSTEKLRNAIGLSQVHVLPYESDGLAYVGFEFGCEWDEEHGLGVVMHGTRVVAMDEAQIAFTWQPEEPPAKKP